MNPTIKRTQISEGINFTEIHDAKFKGNCISVTLVAPLCEQTASAYAILPFILRRGYSQCPKAAEFSRLLSSLYGASCTYSVSKAGDDQLLSLFITGIDDRFTINGENITAEISKILCSLILDPVIEGGSFCRKTFETEKQALIDSIKAELNDKIALASTRCQQVMYEGEPAAISRYGTLESAEKLERREVFDAYNELLKKAKIEIIFTGSGNGEIAKEIFNSSFAACAEREKPFKVGSHALKPSSGIKEKTEEYSISQSKLTMGFTCQSTIYDEDESAMAFMCVILGGAPFSKLFLNVREKLSLCYYCSASYDRYKGTILIKSGIEKENREKAQREILNQLEAIQNGEISDEEIANTKRLISNSYTEISDNMLGIMRFYLTRLCEGNITSPQAELEKLENITATDIVNAARKVSLDTVYFMQPKEE